MKNDVQIERYKILRGTFSFFDILCGEHDLHALSREFFCNLFADAPIGPVTTTIFGWTILVLGRML